MASEADLWHTRAVGKCTRLGYKAFKVGGERFPVGPGTIMRVRFEWGAGEHKVEVPGDGTAPIRSYMLKKGDGQFGANIAFGWMLNYHHICSIDNLFEWFCDQARWVLAIMETSEVAKQHLYVDTNWLVSDGAECVVDNIMRAIRVPFPTPNLNGLDVGPNSIGILGRVDFRFTNHKKAPKVKGFLQYTSWPANLKLCEFVPPKVQMLVTANAGKPTLSIDQPPPDVDDPLTGGSEFKEGDLLLAESNPYFVRCYSYRESPGAELKYIRLRSGSLTPHATILTGYEMFDERALRAMATDPDTLALLAQPAAQRTTLGEKFLLPTLNDPAFIKHVNKSFLVDEIITVAPGLTMGAKWRLGVHGYFQFDHAVGTGGELLPCPALSRLAANALERRLFV